MALSTQPITVSQTNYIITNMAKCLSYFHKQHGNHNMLPTLDLCHKLAC